MMSINPDAHSTREIDLTHWGVEMARKGGVPQPRAQLLLAATAHAAPEETQERARMRRVTPLKQERSRCHWMTKNIAEKVPPGDHIPPTTTDVR